MMSAVSPIWDGNETWLVVAGVVLWSAFPVVYATLFSAFYLPLLLMLAGLILRGVAFEYRHQTERMRWVWDAAFAGAGGSLVAAFIQGLMVGALVEELPIAGGQYIGGEFGWFSAFSVLCGIGLCLGYSLVVSVMRAAILKSAGAALVTRKVWEIAPRLARARANRDGGPRPF